MFDVDDDGQFTNVGTTTTEKNREEKKSRDHLGNDDDDYKLRINYKQKNQKLTDAICAKKPLNLSNGTVIRLFSKLKLPAFIGQLHGRLFFFKNGHIISFNHVSNISHNLIVHEPNVPSKQGIVIL
ncbi:hypothetical protein DERP_012764 [Dermatophagoides pteronyssinus]|uniref:Uncharacterized protein n=1 Tax=Dermatophagoides pteronyssinus TaxID=6956 RepID=A0ABQ8JQZ1_DERPT|nr:hypothetical protein DERP_012764 [Dermatophagoides pteronyssinus]